jgi:hypothetical protein
MSGWMERPVNDLFTSGGLDKDTLRPLVDWTWHGPDLCARMRRKGQ